MNSIYFKRSLSMLMAGLFFYLSMPAYAGIQEDLAKLEAETGGRLGVSAINTAKNISIQYRATTRFPMGCTSKVIVVSAILKMGMDDPHFLQQKVVYQKSDLLEWSPITKEHLSAGLTNLELCSASISYSDNTAANLLANQMGGAHGITAFARAMGDKDFQLDHLFPDEAMSGPDGHDSTTPAAMAQSLQKLALGHVLSLPLRQKLQDWLKQTVTGNERIRAGVPKGWVVGDKTGTGYHYGTTNDIAVLWPPKCAPLVVAIYYTNPKKDAPKRNDVIAKVTQLLIQDFAQNDYCLRA